MSQTTFTEPSDQQVLTEANKAKMVRKVEPKGKSLTARRTYDPNIDRAGVGEVPIGQRYVDPTKSKE